MIGYDEIKQTLRPHLRTGQCVSFPVPIIQDGAFLDAVFVFTVDRSTNIPNKPSGLLKANMSDGSVAFDAAAFDGVAFLPSRFFMPEGYSVLRCEARELYAHARDYVFNGSRSAESMRYAEIVWALSQDCVKPYYRRLSQTLFGNLE